MTDDERTMLREVHERMESMDAFLMKPMGPGKPSRAEALDKLLDAVGATRLTGRALLWAAGVVLTFGAVVAVIKGWVVPT